MKRLLMLLVLFGWNMQPLLDAGRRRLPPRAIESAWSGISTDSLRSENYIPCKCAGGTKRAGDSRRERQRTG